MSIQVRFFASLKQRLQRDSVEVSQQPGMTAADVWRLATDDSEYPDNTLCAINMEYKPLEAEVSDGDEVAFFPPVTGG